MSSLEPRVRAYSGIKYEMYKLSSKISPDKVRDEIKSKQPLYVTYRPKFKAPSLSSINSTVMKEIGSGNFAAVMSGYFYAPLTCELFFLVYWGNLFAFNDIRQTLRFFSSVDVYF